MEAALTPPVSVAGAESALLSRIPRFLLLSAASPDRTGTDNATPSPSRLAAIPASPNLHRLSPSATSLLRASLVCCAPLSVSPSSPQLPSVCPSQKPSDRSLSPPSCAYPPDILDTAFFPILQQDHTSYSHFPDARLLSSFAYFILSCYISVSFSSVVPAWIICSATICLFSCIPPILPLWHSFCIRLDSSSFLPLKKWY